MAHDSDPIVIDPPGAHRATVIWLHGLGADGGDFVPIVPELRLPAGHGVRFVFPHAPHRPITINRGMVMRGWYDVQEMDLTRREDEAGIDDSARIVAGLVAAEGEAGIGASSVVLAGFSQGGAVALHAGLRHTEPLAGIIALSTYLPVPDRLDAEARPTNRDTPILMAHGLYDPVIPARQGEASRDWLRQRGYRVEWREYPMQHSVCAEEVADIARGLREMLDA